MFQVPSLSDLNAAAALPSSSVVGRAYFDRRSVRAADRKQITAWLTAAGPGVSLVLALLSLADVVTFGNGDEVFFGSYVADEFTDMVNVIVLVTALLGVMVAYNYLDRTNMQRGEYYYLLLFTVVGVMFMGGAGDLIVIFVALELLSIPLYILTGFRRPQEQSEESAMKYFLLGAFSGVSRLRHRADLWRHGHEQPAGHLGSG